MTNTTSAQISLYQNPAAPVRQRVDVTNADKRRGNGVAQMYIRDWVRSVTRLVKELKGFQKVSPKSGEFEIMVGNFSRDTDLQKQMLTVIK